MTSAVTNRLIDTGPLVALLVGDDTQHAGSSSSPNTSLPPCLHVAVISEVLFLLKRDGHDADDLFALVETGFLRSEFDFHGEYRHVRDLMRRYRERPMSFADACLVRMSKLQADTCVWTLDRDFLFYRIVGAARASELRCRCKRAVRAGFGICGAASVRTMMRAEILSTKSASHQREIWTTMTDDRIDRVIVRERR